MALRKVASLWEKEGKRGGFLSGVINEDIKKDTAILIFKNDPATKKSANSPYATINVRVPD